MKRGLLGVSACLVTLLASLEANAGTVHGAAAPASTCPMGAGQGDGCEDADADAVVRFPNFLTASSAGYTVDGVARQSGQAPYAVSPKHNLAGVAFGVGYSLSRAGGALKDPADLITRYRGKCEWEATGLGNQIDCSHVNNLDVENYDFTHTSDSHASSQKCIPLQIRNSVTGSIKIINNKFVNGFGCVDLATKKVVGIGYLVNIQNGTNASIDFERNLLDGRARDLPVELDCGACLRTTSSNVTIKKNAVLHLAARPIVTGTFGDIDAEDNYVEGFILPPTSPRAHGEFILNARTCGDACAPATMQNFIYINNVVVTDTDMPAGQGNASLWVTTGHTGDTIVNVKEKYNVTINNPHGGAGGRPIMGTGATFLQDAIVLNASISQNFVDPGGRDPGSASATGFCYRASSPDPRHVAQDRWLAPDGVASNVNLRTGVVQRHWSIDGVVGLHCDRR